MKIRNGFVSNSSSSSFIKGKTGKDIEITVGEVFNLPALLEVKESCIKANLPIPEKIKEIEKQLYNIEDLTGNEVWESREETIDVDCCIWDKWEDGMIIDVDKIPDGVKYIEFGIEGGY